MQVNTLWFSMFTINFGFIIPISNQAFYQFLSVYLIGEKFVRVMFRRLKVLSPKAKMLSLLTDELFTDKVGLIHSIITTS